MFDSLVVSVGFVVDGVALGRVFHRALRVLLCQLLVHHLFILISHLGIE